MRLGKSILGLICLVTTQAKYSKLGLEDHET